MNSPIELLGDVKVVFFLLLCSRQKPKKTKKQKQTNKQRDSPTLLRKS